MNAKIAVVLCGSGYLDGSEINEAVATLWALSENHAEARCYAPDREQTEVVNCLTGRKVTGETRNMQVEAARIARGKVLPLSDLNPAEFDGIILPGGFGAAKNLCSFAFEGIHGTVMPELKSVLEKFHQAGKPIGAICIAPMIVGMAFPKKNFAMTLGEKSEASAALEKLGHQHVECATDQCHVDRANRVVTTSAFMDSNAALRDLFHGIRELVSEVIALTSR